MLTHLRILFKGVTRKDVSTVLIIILVGFGSFGLGHLSSKNTQQTTSVTIEQAFEPSSASFEQDNMEDNNSLELVAPTVQGSFVGSKNSDKYHYPWCPGAQRIKEENKVWFTSREDAESRGYTPAGNCKGL